MNFVHVVDGQGNTWQQTEWSHANQQCQNTSRRNLLYMPISICNSAICADTHTQNNLLFSALTLLVFLYQGHPACKISYQSTSKLFWWNTVTVNEPGSHPTRHITGHYKAEFLQLRAQLTEQLQTVVCPRVCAQNDSSFSVLVAVFQVNQGLVLPYLGNLLPRYPVR